MKALNYFLTVVVISMSYLDGQAQALDRETQIQQALLAAPEAYRNEAKVHGYDENGKFTVLREGSNQMVCLADDPEKEGFSVAAYHIDLDPYMERGRQLKAAGKTYQERFDIVESEVRMSKLMIPDKSTLFVLSGKFSEDGNPTDLYLRYVVYIPYATAETTGLPLAPVSEGGPWLMDPGTHKAHIMINPPKN